jgi:diacylglycerol kinase family enzyme
MGHVVVITNPHAKQNARDPERFDRLTRLVGDQGVVYETREREQLPQIAADLVHQDIDLLGICGGDGTNHIVLTALLQAYLPAGRPLPPVVLLRGGSMNTIGWNVGIRCAAEKKLGDLLEKRALGQPWTLINARTIHVNDHYGFIFGNGYVVNFLREYYASSLSSGPLRAADITYRATVSVFTRGDMAARLGKRYEAEVTVDGRRLDYPSFGMILVGSMEYLGIGFKALYKARQDLEHFHVFATALPPIKIAAQVHRFYAGKPLQGSPHFDEQARELRLRCAEPLDYQLDGELYVAADQSISLGPVLTIAVG